MKFRPTPRSSRQAHAVEQHIPSYRKEMLEAIENEENQQNDQGEIDYDSNTD